MVLEQEIASFELASLELAGGLYANDCDLFVSCLGSASPTAARVSEGAASIVSVTMLSLEGQLAGTLQADMTVSCNAAMNGLAQAIGASVTTCQGQAITSLGLQAYGATVAQSMGISAGAYLAGAYATTQQQATGSAAVLTVGQGVNQSTATLIASANLYGIGQAVNLSAISSHGTGSTSLLLQAYGDQRLSASGSAAVSLPAVRLREGSHAIYGTSSSALHIGAYATTALTDAVGDFELADFELGTCELGGELVRSGAAHADMICVGQAIAKSDMSSISIATSDIKPAYALQAAFLADAGAVTDWKFSVFRDAQTSINGIAVAQYALPNARLFRVMAKSHDSTTRGYESRSIHRPAEIRGVKRPYEARFVGLPNQPRTTSWS